MLDRSTDTPNQNVIQLYRHLGDGQWVAHIGPNDGRGVQSSGGTPCQALGRLIQRIHGGQYVFDPHWAPPSPAAEAAREALVSERVLKQGQFVTFVGPCPWTNALPASVDEYRFSVFRDLAPDQLSGEITGGPVSQSVDPVPARFVGQPQRAPEGEVAVELAP